MKIKLIVFILLLGAIGHNSYGMIRSFRPGQVKPLIGNYAKPYNFGSRRIALSISPDFIPESIQRALRGKGIERRDVFFIIYDLSGLRSPYNMVMHPALQAWTGERIIKKNIDMSFFDTQGILREPDAKKSVPFNGLKKINVNVHPTKEKGVLAYSPNNARFIKGREGLGAGWFVALSPDGKSASISYLVLIYDKYIWELIEGSLWGGVTIYGYFGALEGAYEILERGTPDQRILGRVLENMRRFFIPGYEPIVIEEPEPEPIIPVTVIEEEEEDIVLIARMLELRDRLQDLLNALTRPAAH